MVQLIFCCPAFWRDFLWGKGVEVVETSSRVAEVNPRFTIGKDLRLKIEKTIKSSLARRLKMTGVDLDEQLALNETDVTKDGRIFGGQ